MLNDKRMGTSKNYAEKGVSNISIAAVRNLRHQRIHKRTYLQKECNQEGEIGIICNQSPRESLNSI